MSKVVIIRGRGVINNSGDINREVLVQMFDKGFRAVTGQQRLKNGLNTLFSEKDKISIKINTLGGKMLSTRPEVSISLADTLAKNISLREEIVIWDRTNRELKDSGYRLNRNHAGHKIFGTDTQGVGYNPDLTSYLNIGSLFSSIQTNMITASISLAILKDHGLAGITASMKNYFGAIHNPNKYHDTNCNPYVAELFDTKLIKSKHKISILDGLIIQYHRGPSYHSPWAKNCGLLVFSRDPVAADFVGWKIIEKLRTEKGLPSLREDNREPCYLITAEKMGLGKANSDDIEIIEENV